MSESEQPPNQSSGAGASQRQKEEAADRLYEEQEKQRKGILRHIFEFFVRLLGIGKNRERESSQRVSQEPRAAESVKADLSGTDKDKGPKKAGPSLDGVGQQRSAGDQRNSPDGAGKDMDHSGSKVAHRSILDAANEAGRAGAVPLLSMAKGPSSGPAEPEQASIPLSAMRERAEAVFAAHGEDMKSRIVPEASTDDRKVFDHTRPSTMDMATIDQNLAELMRCGSDVPSQNEVVSCYYAACTLDKLNVLRNASDTSLAEGDSAEAMENYLSEVDQHISKLQNLDIPEDKRVEFRGKLIERMRTLYAEIATEQHGSFDERVLSATEGGGSRRKRQQEGLSM